MVMIVTSIYVVYFQVCTQIDAEKVIPLEIDRWTLKKSCETSDLSILDVFLLTGNLLLDLFLDIKYIYHK